MMRRPSFLKTHYESWRLWEWRFGEQAQVDNEQEYQGHETHENLADRFRCQGVEMGVTHLKEEKPVE